MTPDIVFLHANAEPHCVARVDKHFNHYWTLQFMDAGAIELIYGEERRELRCSAGGAWFWPAFPGPRIRFHPARDVHTWSHRYAAFTGPRVQHWVSAGLWPRCEQPAPRAGANRESMDELLQLLRAGGPWPLRRATNVLEGLLLELAEARAAAQHEEPWLEQTRRALLQSGAFGPDYARLARDLGMGLSTLRRKYKAATGQTLHETLLSHRYESARRLLGETDLPVKTIATRLGYRDVYFFSNQFKQLAGVTPNAYRRSRQ